MLFERTALSQKPQKLIKQELELLRKENNFSPDLVFRDPFILDFWGLKDAYSDNRQSSAPIFGQNPTGTFTDPRDGYTLNMLKSAPKPGWRKTWHTCLR